MPIAASGLQSDCKWGSPGLARRGWGGNLPGGESPFAESGIALGPPAWTLDRKLVARQLIRCSFRPWLRTRVNTFAAIRESQLRFVATPRSGI